MKKKVIILATGGTIAGRGETGKETGYISGSLSINEILETVPAIHDLAEIETVQFCSVNSDDITSDMWIRLARTINDYAARDEADGFVITHGTDTLEETAYFLNLTIKTEKPVVLTGSMRPATAISADGPMNLYQAVCTAASSEAAGKGVLAVFSDMIFAARTVTKMSTYNVMAINAGETGAMGIIRNDRIYVYEVPNKIHTVHSEFDIDEIRSLPDVPVIFFSVDANADLLRYAAENSKGIVIAGAGAGEFSEEFADVIRSLDIPVVISSRIYNGIITQDSVLCPNTIAADNLSPQKAAILLRLALAKNYGREDILRLFSEY